MMKRLLPGLLLFIASFAAGAAPLPSTQIAAGIYLHSGVQEDWLPANNGDIANLVLITGTRCAAVVDTGGSPAVGRGWREAVAQRTKLPVCYVILTHAHVDHMLGNAAFAGPDTRFVASARFAAAQTAREDYIEHTVERDFGQHLAAADFVTPALTATPDKPLQLDLGGRTLRIEAWPTAHTDNDLSVYDEQTKTLILGDLLFAGHLPVLDGKLRGWLAVMDTLHARRDVALAVPGHGPISRDWPAALDAQTRYLQALQRDVRAAIKAGLPLQKAVDTVPCDGASSWLLVDQFHKRNVTAAFAELEWED
ncbi:quinoprotein relay system zinc metallohydrolase 2 [Paucibacter sp. R3-3]|uniref:Quinoprotein relay system zinc metallohydrolase 2 n=1 Tax=Roseateles agri TaxID=3098619 RepID=A0ABU5DIT3_9BURK|nr:quinoprotein relay system zinc metallohydrolase 2 [Paucibacter sp. R3-3]MDY0746200.1 quinoprotein relay system zinc metallohydrolase 2 [Paucibacter sp. R3-3]